MTDSGQNAAPAASTPSVAMAQIATVMRDVGLCVSVLTAVMGLMRAGDLVGLINYLQTEPALQVAGIAVAVAIVVWRQWNARHVVHKIAVLTAADEAK